MKNILVIFFILAFSIVNAQPLHYSVSNAHSHNDYEQQQPFWLAFQKGFGSIEADVFLSGNQLLVAHHAKDTSAVRNLTNLYLSPLAKYLQESNDLFTYQPQKKLLLLIDCKTEAYNTLQEIIEEIKSFPALIQNKNLYFVITGNQPNKDSLFTYPPFIWFDGDVDYSYSKKNLEKIALYSTNFKKYSTWNGAGYLPDSAQQQLSATIKKAHGFKKPIRFWGAPDISNAWKVFKKLEVDYINTDKISDLARFLKSN